MSLDIIIETGSYTGNSATQSIAIGWQPALVMIASARTSGPAAGRALSFKLPDMVGDDFGECSSGFGLTTLNGITLTSTGFDVGSDDVINDSGFTFHWVAIREGPAVDSGTYTGSGGTTNVTTGRQPSVVLCPQVTPPGPEMLWKFASQASDAMVSFESAIVGSTGLTLVSTGFDATNEADDSGETFDWVALYDIVGSTRHFETGSFTGDGNASQSISLGRQPKFVMIFNETSGAEYGLKSDTMAGDDYALLDTAYSFDTTGGITLVADGFDVAADFNTLNDVYRFMVGYV